jgi:uncharacterized membrane protein (DUF2068 family)
MPERLDLGLRVIVLYKAVKAVAELALLGLLVALAAGGELDELRELASTLKENVTSRWSQLAGRLLGAAASEHGVRLLETGLVLDGALTGVEGFSLWRRYRWGPWLVVAATAIPMPLELAELARTWSPGRGMLLLVNLAVVVYLARRMVRRREGPAA